MDKKLDMILDFMVTGRKPNIIRGVSPPHSAHARLDSTTDPPRYAINLV